ncbi:putative FtsX-related transmembrane transport protein [Fulvivirga imtechensis AK7]|uniref:Putative FtsX-related transmembrane transport protein n=1 Tax=Fulvivirga imtechensis AK7 TaxID=1237149 RepID=L8JMF9_9BACT|nr:ABC transporter permease [Fulvivirga imtechensis]ELR70000.1 putative FtsX-related transmembrane transport protein [Fulvivirga imtechensis AK7]
MKTQVQPPKWAIDFLEGFCPDGLFECILGDLLEQFDADVEQYGDKKARRMFVWQVFRFFRPGIILRNKFKLKIINTIMLSSYFKVAIRNMQKRKLYSFINAFGLSIGIAFCMLIYLFIQDEKSFDQFHVNKENIYRLEEKSYDTWKKDNEDPYRRSAYLQTGLREVLKDELREVKMATRYNSGASGIVRYGDKIFTEKLTYVDGDFFKMFSFPLIQGNADKLFEHKQEVVLTPAIAEKYFGDEDPMGKTIEIDVNGNNSYTVTGIINKAPANSSLNFELLIPQQNRPYYDRNLDQWASYSTPTFVQLAKNTDLQQFSDNLDKIVDKYMSEDLRNWRERGNIPSDIKVLEIEYTNLSDIHLHKAVSWEKASDPQYSLILGGIAVLILLIACINYVSLALTTSTSRRIEVGIRKAIGAQKGQLVYQFGFESLALAIVSMVIGLGLVVLFLPAFNEFTNKSMALTATSLLELGAITLILTLFVGLIAGSYPALFLSSFRPAQVLKGGFTSRLKVGFTKPLVVLQFALSAFLIISSVIMYRQMQYVTTKDLGYNQDQILAIPTQTGWNEEANKMVSRFRNRMQQDPAVISVAGTSSSFNQGWSQYGYEIDGEQKDAYVYAVDPYYIPTLEIELADGRNFDERIASDSNAVIINEALARDMGWEQPLEKHLNWRNDSTGLGAKVIGVVKNYHFLSLERDIEPMFLTMDKENAGYLTTMMVKIAGDDIPAALEAVRTGWKGLAPDKPFDYTFVDEDVARQYASHQRWMSIMGLSTGFAILISCLGLFGLAGINAVNRTREIGIRKVMGAELMNIFVLLNRQYVWLALIAFTLAAPLSYYVMDKWLSDFKFAISMSWELFALSMGAGLFVALLTVSYHAIRTAMVNPAETLKYE